MTTTTFHIDNQSRITRIGCKAKAFDTTFGCFVQAYVLAKKVRNTLTVSEIAFGGLQDNNGVELAGSWKIVRQEGLNLICEKL